MKSLKQKQQTLSKRGRTKHRKKKNSTTSDSSSSPDRKGNILKKEKTKLKKKRQRSSSSSSSSPAPKKSNKTKQNSKSKKKKRQRSVSSDPLRSPSKKTSKKSKKKISKHKVKHKKRRRSSSSSSSLSDTVIKTKLKKTKTVKPVLPNELTAKTAPTQQKQEEPDARSLAMRPMTQEEWAARQSVVRRVYDEESGRTRLVKGDGEILEEIVSRQRHQEINRQATKGDGNAFQTRLGLNK